MQISSNDMESDNTKSINNLVQEANSNNDAGGSQASLSSSSSSSSVSDTAPNRNYNESSSVADANKRALTTQEALVVLHDDIDQEIKQMKTGFSKRPLLSWLQESISFRSELSKMRWPSVVFMTAQAIAHFIVAFVLEVENLATNWVGFQGFVLTLLLIFNLVVNVWDTKLRFKELLMKAEQIRDIIGRCSEDKCLLRKWRKYSWHSVDAKNLFIPKSPCVHQTLAYRDESCLNLPDYLLVRGDIIHLFPGERAPGECVSLKTIKGDRDDNLDKSNSDPVGITLQDGEIFHSDEIYKKYSDQNASKLEFQLQQNGRDDVLAHARLKKAIKGTDFLMLSTPYIKSLRISMQRSHKRPVNSIEKECFIVSRKYFETYVIPSVFILSTIVTAIHYGYLDLTDSDQQIKTISIAYLLLRPSLTIMPFLPWMFPCFWMAVNAYGSARLLCCAETQRKRKENKMTREPWNFDGSPNWSQRASEGEKMGNAKFVNLLATPTAAGSSDQNKHEDEDLLDLQNNIEYKSIFKLYMDLIRGRGGHVWRSSSLLQVLGCLTSLCCIDKVGILSWSNPTPEKVFVLTTAETTNQESTRNHLTTATQSDHPSDDLGSSQDEPTPIDRYNQGNENLNSNNSAGIYLDSSDQASNQNMHLQSTKHHHPNNSGPTSVPEVLDVSQNFNTYQGFLNQVAFHQAGRLQFDDLNWRRYLDNLKPLGLTILMNNCCENSFGDYFRFYKHIFYESILRCNLTPVVKRRCLCALSELIGFTKKATKNYEYINQIGAYKLIDPGTIKKGKFVSSLENTTRLKLPFPNMICNLHRDLLSGSYQIFSQGTADVILDACAEFWDGKRLIILDDTTRKKIKDFYHRTSLTSYCSAFAYTPLLKSYNLGDHYIELPSENSKLSLQLRKLTNEHHEEFLQKQIISIPENSTHKNATIMSSQDNMLLDSNETSPSNINHNLSGQQTVRTPASLVLRRHLSAENIDDYNHQMDDGRRDSTRLPCPLSEGRRNEKHKKLNDVLDELTDQVFVGMVAMQYQACPDFVGLVEQLEHACIRFVHFSKENELRSRVFSEKMGLESGWNCHISLQSDQDLDKADKCGFNLNKSTNQSGEGEDHQRAGVFTPTTRVTNMILGNRTRPYHHRPVSSLDSNEMSSQRVSSISSDERTLYSWHSLPSLVMQVISKVGNHLGKQHHHHQHHNGLQNNTTTDQQVATNSTKIEELNPGQSGEETYFGSDYGDLDGGGDQMDSESSTKDEGFESIAFDMSNRAKLPKGIENIRPHLETVDNIPLQVSLFTDCTPSLTKEMIEIMQDYGEIVCVIGSSSSRLNTPTFLQANASIAIEPLMPECCTKNHGKREPVKSDNLASKRKSRPRTRHGIKQKQRQRRKPQEKQQRHHTDNNGGRQSKYRQPSSTSRDRAIEDDNGDFTTVQMVPRPSNPRDRLGIGPAVPTSDQNNDHIRAKRRRQLSSSSSSEASLSSPSVSESDDGELDSSSSRSTPSRRSSSKSSRYSSSSRSTKSTTSSSSSSPSSPSSKTSQPRADKSSISDDGESDSELLNGTASLITEFPQPSSLASKLASLPCSYSYNRRDQVNLYSLIMEARHFTFKMKNTFVCMICFALSISSAQFLASILFLPPMLSSGLTIWLTVVVVPLMSFSLMSTTMDSQVMKIAVGKNLQLKPENITFFVICYLIKFIPSIIVVVLNFGLIIAHSCKLTGFGSSSLGPCWMFTYVQHGNATSSDDADEDLLWSTHLLTAQVSAAFLMVLYFVVISSGFVHRSHLMWQRSPTRNRFWVVISLVLIIGQVFYNQLVLRVNLNSSKIPYEFLASLPLHIWFISFVWPILVIGINLLVKRAEIKATIRQQRRARFDFNTKLGMNSPF